MIRPEVAPAPLAPRPWSILDAPVPDNPFATTTTSVVLTLGVLAIGVALVLVRSRWRDQQATNPPPPPALTPPAATPAEIAYLTQTAGWGLAGMVVDLAVRGHLQLQESSVSTSRGPRWDCVLRRSPIAPDDPRDELLAPYERLLLDELFAAGDVVTLDGLRYRFAPRGVAVIECAGSELRARGLIRSDDEAAQRHWLVSAVSTVVLGAGLTLVLARFTEVALVGVALVAVGVLVGIRSTPRPGRTAAGTALVAELEALRSRLNTIDERDIPTGDHHHLFERLVPYAVVLGVEERWTDTFQELARRGVDVKEPTWWVSARFEPGRYWLGRLRFAGALTMFRDECSTALTAVEPQGGGGG